MLTDAVPSVRGVEARRDGQAGMAAGLLCEEGKREPEVDPVVKAKEDNMVEMSIEEAVTECRKAWGEFFTENGLSANALFFPDRTRIQAWCLHHEVHHEALTEPIENRIRYILEEKRPSERVCRFRNLRPM